MTNKVNKEDKHEAEAIEVIQKMLDKHHAEASDMIQRMVPGMIKSYMNPEVDKLNKKISKELPPRVLFPVRFHFPYQGQNTQVSLVFYSPQEFQKQQGEGVFVQFSNFGIPAAVTGIVDLVLNEFYDSTTLQGIDYNGKITHVYLKSVVEQQAKEIIEGSSFESLGEQDVDISFIE